jgi:CHAD domain-containing protein
MTYMLCSIVADYASPGHRPRGYRMTNVSSANFKRLAARHTGKHLKRLAKEIKGSRNAKDIECVHQARVATRRLQTALDIYAPCFSRKKSARWQKGLTRLLRGLGEARDCDVQIDYISDVLDTCHQKRLRPGIARLLLRLTQERHRLQARLYRVTARFTQSNTMAEIQAVVRTFAAKPEDGDAALDWTVYQHFRGAILEHLQRLLGYQDCLWDADDFERHHAMRILAKHFRYAMEACRGAYGRSLDATIVAARELQTLLGDVHDCDIWVEDLLEFQEQELKRTEEYFGNGRAMARLKPGLDYLVDLRRRQRQAVFVQLGETWNDMQERGVWQRLVGLLQRRAQPPESSPVAKRRTTSS